MAVAKKSEIRISKSETNPKFETEKTRKFEFRISNLFRISDFEIRIFNFRGQDLNLRPPGYEPGELPLLHPGMYQVLAGAAAFLLPLCPLKVRVGANSPSLCPIISSVTNNFMKCRPLWIRNVWPMKSGTTV